MRRAAVFACVLLLLAVPTARAQSEDEATRIAAKTLGYAGVEAFQAGDFAGARERLEKAFALLKAPSLGLWSARALAKTGRLVQASERYREVMGLAVSTGDVAIQKQAQQDAARELAELTPRIPRLQIEIRGARASDVSVTIDAAPVRSARPGEPLPLDPGRRAIEGRHGGQTVRTEVMLSEKQLATVELRFIETAAIGPAASSAGGGKSLRTLGWVALGVGGAGLATGAAVGISLLADREHFSSSDDCVGGNRCGPEERSRVNAYNDKRIISGVTLISGGVLAAAGAYLVFFRAAPAAESPRLGLAVGPSALALYGRF
jgi:hypothetical protein